MPRCQTRYFGTLEYAGESVIDFPAALPGFPEERRFLPVELPEHAPLIFLQSLARPELCFPMLPVASIAADYRLELGPAELEALGLRRQPRPGEDVLCLAVIAIAKDGITANLLAPVVIAIATRRGVQAIQDPRRYSHQHRLAESEVAACS